MRGTRDHGFDCVVACTANITCYENIIAIIVLRELNGLGREMNENYNLSFKHSCILHCNAWLDFVEHRKIQKFVHRNNDLANLILSDIGKRSSLSRHGLHV
jgi:hypothetical protein